jgi:hypothetical protein
MSTAVVTLRHETEKEKEERGEEVVILFRLLEV